MSLHGNPIHVPTQLPDGRHGVVHVEVAHDSYIADSEINTVVLELRVGHGVIASVTTVLNANQESEARRLATRVAEGLASGELEPTAHALEPLADDPPL